MKKKYSYYVGERRVNWLLSKMTEQQGGIDAEISFLIMQSS